MISEGLSSIENIALKFVYVVNDSQIVMSVFSFNLL